MQCRYKTLEVPTSAQSAHFLRPNKYRVPMFWYQHMRAKQKNKHSIRQGNDTLELSNMSNICSTSIRQDQDFEEIS
jgi:hypothetical protein